MKAIDLKHPGKYFVSATLHDWLLLSSAFSGLLLLVRVIVTNTASYFFLPWNLFLAFIPYLVTGLMKKKPGFFENKINLCLALFAWLLFIPNSFYIITDLFHLARFRSAPAWFDLLMIFSFAWNGIFFGIISLRRVELIITKLKGENFSIFFVIAIMWLNAFGIYIGRFLRYNSWDVIADPFSLAREILDMVFHPIQYSYAWGMTISYAVFMSLIYLTIRKIGEAFLLVK